MTRERNLDLVVITLRLRTRDVKAARAVAKTSAIPYQHVIREWVANGARKAARRG